MIKTYEEIKNYNVALFQPKNGYRYNEDSFYIIDFIKNIKKNANVIELCAGVGVIGLCLLKKFSYIQKLIFVELQEPMCQILEENIKINGLNQKTNIINSDYRKINKKFFTSFDVVVANPPYRKLNTGRISKDFLKAKSRHELEGSLQEFIEISSKLLKDKGKLYFIFLSERLIEIFDYMTRHHIEPKNIQFIHPKKNLESKLVLIEGMKKGNPGVKVLSPLFVDECKIL